jgi:putative membrane protein
MVFIRNLWNLHIWDHRERIARLIFLGYVALFPGSILSVAFGLVPPESRWFGGVLLMFQGVSLIAWLWNAIGRASLIPTAIILIGSFAVEYIGATTDFPFGPYDYTAVLGYRVAGIVPLVIMFAWVMATYGAWMVASLLPFAQKHVTRGILTGAIVALFDLQIEPVAVHIHGYWEWHASGLYYGVPSVNFLGWFVVGTIFSWCIDRPLRFAQNVGASRLPILAIGGSCVMFLVMNGVAGHWVAMLLSVFSVGALFWIWRAADRQL